MTAHIENEGGGLTPMASPFIDTLAHEEKDPSTFYNAPPEEEEAYYVVASVEETLV